MPIGRLYNIALISHFKYMLLNSKNDRMGTLESFRSHCPAYRWPWMLEEAVAAIEPCCENRARDVQGARTIVRPPKANTRLSMRMAMSFRILARIEIQAAADRARSFAIGIPPYPERNESLKMWIIRTGNQVHDTAWHMVRRKRARERRFAGHLAAGGDSATVAAAVRLAEVNRYDRLAASRQKLLASNMRRNGRRPPRGARSRHDDAEH